MRTTLSEFRKLVRKTINEYVANTEGDPHKEDHADPTARNWNAGLDEADEASKAPPPKLTPEQRRKVKQLMDDEGESRASATAWVLHFGLDEIDEGSGAKLYWCCAGCGSVEPVEVEGEGDQGYEEGDEEPCVDCATGTSRVTLLNSPDDFVGGK